jgi:hypothetical protein
MNMWATFWGVVLVLVLTVFAILAVVVAIGGFSDVKSLFATIVSQHEESPDE